MGSGNGVPTCTICGAPACYFPADGDNRCLPCMGADVTALRSDVPIEEHRVEASNSDAMLVMEPCPRCAAAEASADAAHAALEATMLRLGEVEAVLEEFPGTGGPAALRKLRGEALP